MAEIDRYLATAGAGSLVIQFGPGEIHSVTRSETITAPPPAAKGYYVCPTCHGPLGSEDYGAKLRCAACAFACSRLSAVP